MLGLMQPMVEPFSLPFMLLELVVKFNVLVNMSGVSILHTFVAS